MEFRRNLFGNSANQTSSKKYEKLKYDEEEKEAFLPSSVSDTLHQQQQVIRQQDETLEKIGSSVGVLKGMSEKIGTEIGDHLVIMDEMGNQMDRTDSTMSVVMKKLQKVSHLSDDKSQWTVIIVLLIVLLVVLLLFFIL